MLEAGDLVAIKFKYPKPYFYPVGIILKVESNTIGEVTSVTVRKSNKEQVQRHVTGIILLEKGATQVVIHTKSVADDRIRRSPRL